MDVQPAQVPSVSNHITGDASFMLFRKNDLLLHTKPHKREEVIPYPFSMFNE